MRSSPADIDELDLGRGPVRRVGASRRDWNLRLERMRSGRSSYYGERRSITAEALACRSGEKTGPVTLRATASWIPDLCSKILFHRSWFSKRSKPRYALFSCFFV